MSSAKKRKKESREKIREAGSGTEGLAFSGNRQDSTATQQRQTYLEAKRVESPRDEKDSMVVNIQRDDQMNILRRR